MLWKMLLKKKKSIALFKKVLKNTIFKKILIITWKYYNLENFASLVAKL